MARYVRALTKEGRRKTTVEVARRALREVFELTGRGEVPRSVSPLMQKRLQTTALLAVGFRNVFPSLSPAAAGGLGYALAALSEPKESK